MTNNLDAFQILEDGYWLLFKDFWSFSDANAIWVLVGTILLGISASVIGSFAFLRKRSLMGDVLAHAALPGVMVAFILFKTNSPLFMFFGAIFSSFVGLFFMNWLPKNTKIKPDAAMAITLSFFFALGMMLLSYIQGMEVEGKSGLNKILFGQAAAMLPEDLYLLAIVAISILFIVTVFFDKFRLITFNKNYAKSLGLNMFFYETVLAMLIVTSVVIGLQIVGVVLMAAVLLTPIAAAKFWSKNLTTMLVVAGIIGGFSGLISANISYMAPAMPTGPWMVVVLSVLFILSFLFAPEKGLLSNLYKQHRLRLKVREENILRTMYVLNERSTSCTKTLILNNSFSLEDIVKSRSIKLDELRKTLIRLYKKGLITNFISQQNITLSEQGIDEAIDLTRRHRLWENYLIDRVNVDPMDVHGQAEKIEHLLTDKQTIQIEQELHNKVDQDPHGNIIPAKRKKKSSVGSKLNDK